MASGTKSTGKKNVMGWFPGHMARTVREITERLKLVDLVFEVRDARVPVSSRNRNFEKLLGVKKRLILFNKADLADPDRTRRWEAHLVRTGAHGLFINAQKENLGSRLYEAALTTLGKTAGGRVRLMIVGVPNVGKSTLINKLAGRKAAKTGALPGVTRAQQWIRVGDRFELLDTPGVLPPGRLPATVAVRLALTGGIASQAVPEMDQARYVFDLIGTYPDFDRRFAEAYKMDKSPGDFALMLLEVARRRGLLLPGGAPDTNRAAALVGEDFRHARFGPVTLDVPAEEEVMDEEQKVFDIDPCAG